MSLINSTVESNEMHTSARCLRWSEIRMRSLIGWFRNMFFTLIDTVLISTSYSIAYTRIIEGECKDDDLRANSLADPLCDVRKRKLLKARRGPDYIWPSPSRQRTTCPTTFNDCSLEWATETTILQSSFWYLLVSTCLSSQS